jgi:hypothetical protein
MNTNEEEKIKNGALGRQLKAEYNYKAKFNLPKPHSA